MYDVIVAGIGSMGSAACYYQSKKGLRVLGLDRFSVPHEKGSHGGQSRIIRKAYFEHPDYVPLLQGAYNNWQQFEDETGQKFYYPVGVAYLGKPESELIQGVKRSASLYNIKIEEYKHDSYVSDLPQFKLPASFKTIVEPEAGFLVPEKAISAFIREASRSGAEIRTGEKVIKWKLDKGVVKVQTDKGNYAAEKLILTSGAWTSEIIKNLSKDLRVTQQLIAWFKPKNKELFRPKKFKCWALEDDDFPGIFYGFPILAGNNFPGIEGLKVAYHHPGNQIDPDASETFNSEEELKKLRQIIKKYMPEAMGEVLIVKSCLYTNTPDGHFIVDLLPEYDDHVVVACGFSGHGFKFAPIVGEILTDLVTEGKTSHPIEFLKLSRFRK